MVKLEKIEMNGFKSFVTPTEFTFGSGITAVVGPNGCGKSNVADAINWVIGERSSKTLRADHMGDVIFNGTDNRRPVGMAEVSLVLSEPGIREGAGPEGEAGAGDGNGGSGGADVEREPIRITRRLFRSGESEYLIDGKKSRLRDIQELLARLGVGTGVYSIIEQGKVDRVITARPADRRVLIEEAAGIALYKIRKRQAQAKLESTEVNLSRINDIVAELERQIGSLKRQAARARRYARVTESIDRAERVLFHHESLRLESSASETAARKAVGEAEESRAAAALGSAEAALQAAREAAARESLEHQRLRDSLHELDRSIDALRTSVDRAREQEIAAAAQIDRSEREVAEIGDRLAERAEVESSLARRREESASEQRELAGALERVESTARLDAAALQSDEGDLAAAREDLVGLASEVSSARSEIRRLEESVARLQAESARLARDGEGIGAESALVAAARSRHEESLAAARAALSHARKEADAAARLLAMESARCEGILVEREQKRGLLEGIGERIAGLRELEESGLAALAGRSATALRPLKDAIVSSEDLDRAVDAALRGMLRGFVTPSRTEALGFLQDLKREGRGRAVLVPGDAGADPGAPAAPIARPTLAERLGDGRSMPGPVRARLSRVLVAGDLDEAARLHAEAPGFDVVTLQGDLLSSDGWIEGGAELPEEAGVMTLKRLMERLSAESERAQRQIQDLGGSLERARARVALLRSAAEEWRGRCEELGRSLEGLELKGQAIEADAARLALRVEAQAGESERAREDLVAAGSALHAANHLLVEALHREEETRRRAESLVGSLEAQRDALRRRQEDLSALREKDAAARERRAAIEAESAHHLAAAQELERRLEAQRAERETWSVRRQEAARRSESDAAALSDRMAERILAEGAVASSRARAEERSQMLTALESDLALARSGMEAAREALHEIALAEERLAGDRRHLESRVAEKGWGDLAAATASLTGEERSRPAEAVEAELVEWKAARDRMGPVNLMAMEQFNELEQRYNFITSQRKDLEESIRSLRETIARINRQSRERFETAFESIRKNFAEIYSVLFHGGRADLRLAAQEEGETDVLEAGLEITAQPPGKRLQSISLLSGGEKALTAMSLLFAIFRYSPSPFCLLDEVDAALDELNVARFVSLLKTMSEETQFIVITHSRRTMEEAGMLYGVTMEEPGVSRTVSVVMGSPESRREAVRSLPEELAARHRGNGRSARVPPKSPAPPSA